MLSIGGRLTLINAVLSSMPLYTLFIYKIPIHAIQRIDKIRCRFLWQGTNKKKKKYSLITWQVACCSKEYVGRILNLRYINISLLMKW